MKVKDICSFLQELCPLDYAEDFDNVGLLVGDENQEVSGVIISLDTLEKTIDEAVEKGCNVIFSFHPIIFKGLKKITGNTYVERVVLKAIKKDISIVCMHTALDNILSGTSGKMCDVLGLKNRSILIEKSRTIRKLVTFVPSDYTEVVRNSLFEAGAGNIGKYSECSFSVLGQGSFKAKEGANPFLGQIGERHTEKEQMLSVIYEPHQENKLIKALKENHPYEEIAYEIYSLENKNQTRGMGIIGELDKEMYLEDFLKYLKERFGSGGIRYSKNWLGNSIKKVAVLGGSGSFAIETALRKGADAFITADVKYHEFYKGEEKMLIADIGHYESEKYIKYLLFDFLKDKGYLNIHIGEETNSIGYF